MRPDHPSDPAHQPLAEAKQRLSGCHRLLHRLSHCLTDLLSDQGQSEGGNVSLDPLKLTLGFGFLVTFFGLLAMRHIRDHA